MESRRCRGGSCGFHNSPLEGNDLAALGESARLHHEIETLRLGFEFAIDKDGNALSLMSSICGAFGSGLLAGDTGVILNSRATTFSTRPGHPHALVPGHRPRHTILPDMVLHDGVPEFVLGCIGLNNHPQGQVQLLVAALDFGMNPQQACDAPRFRVVMTSDGVQLYSGIPGAGAGRTCGRGSR